MNELVPQKKKTVLKPNQPNQQKTQVWNPLLQRSSFEHAKKYGFLRHSVNQVGILFTHAFCAISPFSFNESIGLATMALCRAAGSGWKTLSTELPDQAMLLARFPPSHCH